MKLANIARREQHDLEFIDTDDGPRVRPLSKSASTTFRFLWGDDTATLAHGTFVMYAWMLITEGPYNAYIPPTLMARVRHWIENREPGNGGIELIENSDGSGTAQAGDA
jgi:hypothetical protein